MRRANRLVWGTDSGNSLRGAGGGTTAAGDYPGRLIVPTCRGRRGHPTAFAWKHALEVERIPADSGLNWLIWVTLLVLGMVAGVSGTILPDDLLSGGSVIISLGH